MKAETIEATVESWTKEPEKALGAPVVTARADESQATDARGLLGMNGAEPDLRNISLEVSVESPDGAAAVKRIADVWQERCPIYLALAKPMDVALQFRAS